jgi:hypothetical protein
MTVTPGADAELARLADEQSDILTTEQAFRLLGRGIVRGYVASRRWRRVCRGIVATTTGRLHRPQQLWVAVLVAGPGAVLAGATALAESGVRGLPGTPIRVLIPAPRKRSVRLPRMPPDMPAVQVTRTRVLPVEHLHPGSPPRTTAARATVDAASWAPTIDAARTVMAMVCQQRRATPDEIFEVLAVRRMLPRARIMQATLSDVAGGAEALSELDFVALCRAWGLPAPRLQEKRRDSAGRYRYLDAYWPAWRLHVEIDGAHHMNV